MSIVLVGVNHKSAPVEVRERLAFSDDACSSGLRALVDGEVVREALIVSTCNRVEILTETASERLNEAIDRSNLFPGGADPLPRAFFAPHLYQPRDGERIP